MDFIKKLEKKIPEGGYGWDFATKGSGQRCEMIHPDNEASDDGGKSWYTIGDLNLDRNPNGEPHRRGKAGINKDLSLEVVLKIASTMNPRPNIFIKNGKDGKWYLKYLSRVNDEILEKHRRRKSHSHMSAYIIEWDEV